MKKLFFSVLIIALLGMKSLAQQSQGTITVGGTFGLQLETEKDKSGNTTQTGDKTTNFTILPSVEYFLMQDLSAGVGIGYMMTKVKHPTATTVTNGMFIINPYVRKYFGLGDKVSAFGEGSLSLGFGSRNTETNGTSVKFNSSEIRIGIIPGIRYNISNRIALDGTIGFIGYDRQSYDGTNDSNTSYNTVAFNLDLSTITFGIRISL